MPCLGRYGEVQEEMVEEADGAVTSGAVATNKLQDPSATNAAAVEYDVPEYAYRLQGKVERKEGAKVGGSAPGGPQETERSGGVDVGRTRQTCGEMPLPPPPVPGRCAGV
ncbi:MAG: hypothetical protein FJ224_00255 [Lentisphaerae bacterium]|nr:hypothetical protein [Lentisphaerota bacterium]